jgi:ribosomal-protein-alanine N-acetyltransferase
MTFDDMARLHHACFGDLRPWSAAELADVLQNPHSFALTQSHGFLIGRAVAGEAEIITLAVDPAARRQGIGRVLVRDFLTQARLQRADSAFLEVAANNVAAIALYHACGFTQTGLRRGYYHPARGLPLDALVLSCPLLPQSPEI